MLVRKSFLAWAFSLFFLLQLPGLSAEKPEKCELAVIGGGPAGVYLSYRLADSYGRGLCLFEISDHLGGRMTDEELGGAFVGTGARRVNEKQDYVIELARELGVTLEAVPQRSQLIFYKGVHGYASKDFVALYPRLKAFGPLDDDPNTALDDELWSLLSSSIKQDPELGKKYPLLNDYILHVFEARFKDRNTAEDAFSYFRGMNRFQAEFKLPTATANYFEYIEKENETGPENFYPKGGMHTFVKRMDEAVHDKIRIFLKEGLKQLEKAPEGYELRTTAGNVFVAGKVVLAIPKVSLSKVGGGLIAEIRKAPQFESILPVPIVVINQLWKDAWWEKAKDPNNTKASGQAWRAWSSDSCVNHVEIPQEAYLSEREKKPTRSVYSDDPNCNALWTKLFYEKGIAGVEEEVVKGLQEVFNHPKHPLKVPKPLATTFHYWPAGWYYAHKNSKYSNAEIAEWSRQPLKDHPELMLVGEGYWLDRPGWSEGAYFSADALIESRKLKRQK